LFIRERSPVLSSLAKDLRWIVVFIWTKEVQLASSKGLISKTNSNSIMPHPIEHEFQDGGFVYKILDEEYIDECVDFYFQFFINGNT